MILAEDIKSFCNPSQIYGQQGEEVKVISKSHNIAIVERADGYRFSVALIKLSESPVPIKLKMQEPETKPMQQEVPRLAPVQAKPKRQQPVNNSQTELFK